MFKYLKKCLDAYNSMVDAYEKMDRHYRNRYKNGWYIAGERK